MSLANRSEWPWWVRSYLRKIHTRDGAILSVRVMMVISVFSSIACFWSPIACIVSLMMLQGTIGVLAATEWVDHHGHWNAGN